MIDLLTSQRCLSHRSPVGAPEQGARLVCILEELSRRGLEAIEIASRDDTLEAITAVHDAGYVERFRQAVERGDGLLDSADNPLSAGTFDAAMAAVEVSLAAADRQASGTSEGLFAAVRPPGHHAERTLAMGFCFFDNVAVAAQHLIRSHGLKRVAIVDFDVHHGNGTQHLFEDRADVFFASSHQFPMYPGTGAEDEVGREQGVGATLNVPLPAGTEDAEFLAAYDEKILPAVERFEPDALLVSAGFDSWVGDPLGGMRVSEDAFRGLGQRFRRLAAKTSTGSCLSVLEGGYDLNALGQIVAAYLDGLSGD